MSATTPLSVPIPGIDTLVQNAARRLQQSLATAAQTGATGTMTAVDLELARSNIQALAFVHAVGVHGAYAYLRDFIARQAVPLKAKGQFLDDWLETYKMPRKAAAAASGTVTGTGVSGSALPAATLMQAGDGRQYRVTAAATVAAGAVSASVTAVEAGAAGNFAAGGTLALVSPVSGVDSTFTVAVGGIAGGVDVESDDDAVYRLQQRLSAEPRGGAPADYARWALSVPGITRAWGIRNPAGAGSAGVVIMADGNAAPGLPTDAQKQAVIDYIRDPRRGPPDELFVVVPTPVTISVTLSVSPDSTAMRAAVLAALQDLFLRESVPGGSIPHSHMVEAISSVAGEYNHTITSPTIVSGGFFTTANWGQLLVLGAVTFS